ncbi:MAG: hypothetical protein R2867_38675 [Caldilineaceae bacterium]
MASLSPLPRTIPVGLLSGPDETLESHLMVFAAEQAQEHRVVDMT